MANPAPIPILPRGANPSRRRKHDLDLDDPRPEAQVADDRPPRPPPSPQPERPPESPRPPRPA